MGDTNPNYYKRLESKLRRYVGQSIWDDQVHFESIYYQDLLQGNQEDYWDDIDDKYSLRWDFLRKFMLFSFADAASIEHSLRNDMLLYLSVHQRISDAFDRSLSALGSQLKPVIVVAHSLGCEQISNYIWDAGEDVRFFADDTGPSVKKKFRRLRSCHRLITTGCNIPVFRAGLNNPQLFVRPNSNFHWKNYFDRHDVLGYPIKNMSDAFNVNWIEDYEVSVGGILTGWNPISHGEYWTDKDVVRPIANEVTRFINHET